MSKFKPISTPGVGPQSQKAAGEVKNHYFFNFVNESFGHAPQSIAGMGIRFTEFLTGGGSILEATLIRFRVLH